MYFTTSRISYRAVDQLHMREAIMESPWRAVRLSVSSACMCDCLFLLAFLSWAEQTSLAGLFVYFKMYSLFVLPCTTCKPDAQGATAIPLPFLDLCDWHLRLCCLHFCRIIHQRKLWLLWAMVLSPSWNSLWEGQGHRNRWRAPIHPSAKFLRPQSA